MIFRVVQESLTNIHRHSGSPSARICLERSKGQVELEISDQGKGMADKLGEMTVARVGVGVRGMEERVRQFDGNLDRVRFKRNQSDRSSSPGKGRVEASPA